MDPDGLIPSTSTCFDGKVKAYRFEAIGDVRGRLAPIYLARIPFEPVRAFLVEAPRGVSRGGHAHTAGRQLLVHVSGRIRVDLSWEDRRTTVVLDEVDNAVLIAAPVWSRQTYCTADSRLVVFCDTPYDPTSYIHEP